MPRPQPPKRGSERSRVGELVCLRTSSLAVLTSSVTDLLRLGWLARLCGSAVRVTRGIKKRIP